MAVRVINGFPQHFDYSILTCFFAGSAETAQQASTIINIESDCIGDTIAVPDADRKQLSIIRDGVNLHEGDGFEWISSGTIQITPALLATEKVWFKFLTGSGMPEKIIPIKDPIATASKLRTTKSVANVYTNNSVVPTGADEAYVESGKTRIRTHFDLTNFDVFVNGEMVTTAQLDIDGLPFWQQIDANTIELKSNHSTVATNIQIVQVDFYFEE